MRFPVHNYPPKVVKATSKWESLAQQAGICKEERELLKGCFILGQNKTTLLCA
jgi:hypothetical protein